MYSFSPNRFPSIERNVDLPLLLSPIKKNYFYKKINLKQKEMERILLFFVPFQEWQMLHISVTMAFFSSYYCIEELKREAYKISENKNKKRYLDPDTSDTSPNDLASEP